MGRGMLTGGEGGGGETSRVLYDLMLSSSTRTVRLRATANGRQNRRHSRFLSVCPTSVATVLLLYARKRVKLETRPPPGRRSFVFSLYTLIEYTCKRLLTVGTTKYKYRNTKNPLPRDLSSPAAAANDAKADVYKYEFIRAAENTITKFFVLFFRFRSVPDNEDAYGFVDCCRRRSRKHDELFASFVNVAGSKRRDSSGCCTRAPKRRVVECYLHRTEAYRVCETISYRL